MFYCIETNTITKYCSFTFQKTFPNRNINNYNSNTLYYDAMQCVSSITLQNIYIIFINKVMVVFYLINNNVSKNSHVTLSINPNKMNYLKMPLTHEKYYIGK